MNSPSLGKTDVWKSKYFWLEDGLLSIYNEDPTAVATAKPSGAYDIYKNNHTEGDRN